MNKKRIAQYCCAALVAAGLGLNIQNAIADYGIGENSLSLVAVGGSNSGPSSNSNSNSNTNCDSNLDSNLDSNYDTNPEPIIWTYDCVKYTSSTEDYDKQEYVPNGGTPPAHGEYVGDKIENGVKVGENWSIPLTRIIWYEKCEEKIDGPYNGPKCNGECGVGITEKYRD